MFKYIKLLMAWQDVSTVYKEEQGKDRPFYLSRRFIGSAIGLLGVFLHVQFGISLDEATQISLINNVEKFIPAGIIVYGSGMAIVSFAKKIMEMIKGGKK